MIYATIPITFSSIPITFKFKTKTPIPIPEFASIKCFALQSCTKKHNTTYGISCGRNFQKGKYVEIFGEQYIIIFIVKKKTTIQKKAGIIKL